LDTVTRMQKRVALALVPATWFLLVFGSTVRVHGAGLACPDWPLCFGEVVPAYEFKVYLEFGHRVVAGFISLAFTALAVSLWRTGVFKARPGVKRLVGLAFLALAVQVVLGGLTVLELLAEWTVASHLLGGNTFACMLLLIALALYEDGHERPPVSPMQRAAGVLLLLAVPAQLGLGGLVAGAEAGLACGTWPTCDGIRMFPTFAGPIGLQVMHRAMGYTVAAIALLNVAVQWRSFPRLSAGVAVLVGIQIALGVANVFLHLPMEVTLAHSGGAALILMTTVALNDRLWRSPVAASSSVARTVEAK